MSLLNYLVESNNKVSQEDLQSLSKNFKSIDYCKDCDHLIDYPDALVWTNVPSRVYGESRISNIAYV